VVIPVRDQADVVGRAVASVLAQTFAGLEVLVVDDGSTDDTALVARQRGARVLRLDRNRGPAHARNRGVEVASGAIVLFVDADVRVHPDAIAVAVDAMRDPGVTAVFGSYDETPGDPGFVSQYKNLFHHWVHQHARTEASTFWTGCGAIRRATFLAIGGFNEGYRRPSIEDIELGFRLRAAGCRIRLEKRMLASHAKRWRLLDLLRTDVLLRGVPWIALMLRDRHAPRDLNLSSASKIATLVAGLFVVSVLLLPLLGQALAVLPALALVAAGILAARLAAPTRGPAPLRSLIAVLAAILAPGTALALVGEPLALLPLGLLVGLALTHLDLYTFFAGRRSVAFAVGVLPMHLLFQLSCAASVPLGLLQHRRDRRRARRAAEGPAIRELPPLVAADEDRMRRAGA
jgi:GT2 family glycosyltransferase